MALTREPGAREEPGCDDDVALPPGYIDELKRIYRERYEREFRKPYWSPLVGVENNDDAEPG